MEGLGKLLDTSDFPARWNCGAWTSLHGWTHILADTATFGAYFAIPVVILVYVRRRSEVAFPALFWLFGIFILSCGTVHLIEASLFWKPWYRLSALVKVVTAVVSWAAVFGLIRVMPQALRLPGLAAMNAELKRENEQRRLVEQELRHRNRDLDEFAYAASHDLKAPLRTIGMLARWIDEDSRGLPEESREHLMTLRNRVRRLERLLDDLFEYSRAGRDSAPSSEVDVADIANTIADMAGLPEGMELEVAADLPPVSAPRAAIEQVLLNLIQNAARHHDRPTGRITVSGSVVDGFVEFAVEDDGPGVPEAYRERVFEMFQTLKPRDEVEGSGIGLTIVKRLVEAHGGHVRLEAAAERGTRVVFAWPLATPVQVPA